MNINCIIIEDEPLAQERLRNYIQRLGFVHVVAAFSNGIDALVFLKSNKIDLVFLDINIEELSGIQLLEAAGIKTEVIITTAYDEYALKGFELNVTDYLLKPYSFERFMAAVDRVKNNLLKKEPAAEKKFIFIKTEYRLEKLLFSDVVYIEGMRDYRKIHAINRQIMTLQTFKELEIEIPGNIICRIHKSYMVAIDKIDSIEKDGVRMKNIIIPVSDTYRKSFFKLLGHSPK